MNEARRRVRVLIGPRCVNWGSNSSIQQALSMHWDIPSIDLTYQFSKSIEDGKEKTKRAIDEGVDTMLVVGGDGMVNSIGSALIGTDVALGVIPVGSGNGFARHFNIPLQAEKAVEVLAHADRRVIDVGTANGRPFFVTCSMAWDATIVRTFEKFPMRGMVPYVLAGAAELLGYVAQPFEVTLDDKTVLRYEEPIVFTVANLTQYGGGAQVAPQACPDDGILELVVICSQDVPRLVANVNRLFNGTFDTLPGVETHPLHSMKVRRARKAPIQVDGELMDAGPDVDVAVLPKALTMLAPRK